MPISPKATTAAVFIDLSEKKRFRDSRKDPDNVKLVTIDSFSRQKIDRSPEEARNDIRQFSNMFEFFLFCKKRHEACYVCKVSDSCEERASI